ncbi:MAG: DNA-directed RNA polymerase subunit K [archaeon]|jgi:DNA-directed RNA polymerase subunit K/omega|nr:DNA-directed RNA polymerase subunit K [archaeon]
MSKVEFTRYENARIIGARALQIAMDAPLLLKISDEELKALKFDSIRIAEKELESGVLPISIHRPMPQKKKTKLVAGKEESVSDEELAAKEHEVEKELVEDAAELGLVEGDELEDFQDEPVNLAGGSTPAEE